MNIIWEKLVKNRKNRLIAGKVSDRDGGRLVVLVDGPILQSCMFSQCMCTHINISIIVVYRTSGSESQFQAIAFMHKLGFFAFVLINHVSG